MKRFHTEEYVNFLKTANAENMKQYQKQMLKCEYGRWSSLGEEGAIDQLCVAVNVGEDCPLFDGLFEFCQLSSGGSLG